MKEYYYSNGDEQNGPVTIEDLKDKINKDTLIWAEGMENWQKADSIEELKTLFKAVPPPIKKVIVEEKQIIETPIINKTVEPKEVKKKKKPAKFIVVSGVVIILAILAYIYINKSNQSYNSDSYNSDSYNSNSYNSNSYNESNNPTPEELEEKNPKDYISIKYELKYRILSGKDQIEGVIKNSANNTTYKNVEIQVNYYTKTGTLLDSENFVLYEYVNPRGYKAFQLKVKSPDGTKSIGVDILGAETD